MSEAFTILEHIKQNKCLLRMPSRNKAVEFIDDIYNFLFPVASGHEMGPYASELAYHRLQGKLQELLLPIRTQFNINCKEVTDQFFLDLPHIYNALMEDANAILEGDPAAEYLEEVILAYPGFFAIVVHRIAHNLYLQKVPIVPRLFSEYAHSITGIDIHPGANIGKSFCIDHGTGIVIGETTDIGDHVKIYQGVTLGALSVDKEMASSKRHPTLEDHVIIYAGSTILGGETVIGENTIIGGNVWLTESVDSNSTVYHKSEVRVKNINGKNSTIL